jgi:sugar (pentulose or hexulose) kinase
MAHRFVLAIDNGSQSTKVHVFDETGRIHASAQRALRPCAYPAPGRVVHPDDDLWGSTVAACREALRRFDGDPSLIEAIGLCTIRFCRVLLDADDRLAEPVLSWMDERVSRAHEANPRVRWVTTSSGYFAVRLTGEHRDAAANYQGVWPIDQSTARWSRDPGDYQRTGMPRELLFELADPGEHLGRLTSQPAAELGLPAGIPVIATANDKAVEALGAGLSEGTTLLSLGTYVAGMTLGGAAAPANPAYWINFASRPGEYLIESEGVRRGMWTVSWVRDLVGAGAADLPGRSAEDLPGRSAEEILDAEAAHVEPGCGGLAVIPDWLAPDDQPYRRGAFIGFDGTQGRAHLFRAVLEGLALTMARNIERMEDALGRRSEELLVTGCGAKSPVMMQILADALGRTARRAEIDDCAGLGAAICACAGIGVHASWADAARAMVRAGESFTPGPDAPSYKSIRARYDTLTHGTHQLCQRAYSGPQVT